jgi:hypothetical protein
MTITIVMPMPRTIHAAFTSDARFLPVRSLARRATSWS